MIVKEFNLGNTKIEVDDTYLVKTEEEKQNVYQQFNKIACEILCERSWKRVSTAKMNKEEVRRFLDYMQDKVEECYKEETAQAIKRFLKEG